MPTRIVKQVDPDYEGDACVAFVVGTPHYVKDGPFGELDTGDRYGVEVHRRPVTGRAGAHCRHEHRSIDAAVRCAKRLLRDVRAKRLSLA